MKKLMAYALTLVMLTSLLAACSKPAPAPAPAPAPGPTAPAPAPAPAPAEKATKYTLSHTSSTESPWQVASKAFADTVNADSKTSTVESFPNGTLCQKNWKVMFEMIQSGSINLGIESITALSSLVPEIGTVQLPFLFSDKAHITKFFADESDILKKWYGGFEAIGMKVLTATPREFRQIINNKRLIKTPDDIKGLKFRVPDNQFFIKVFELMGAKPVPLPSGEIYSSIQLGTVVGEDNSLPVVYDFKTHEVAKNMTLWNYMGDASILVMNKDNFNALSDADKATFEKAAGVWNQTNLDEDAAYTIKAKADMEKTNVKFHEMTEAEKEPFKTLVAPIYNDKKAALGDADYAAFLAAVEAAK